MATKTKFGDCYIAERILGGQLSNLFGIHGDRSFVRAPGREWWRTLQISRYLK